MEGLCPICRKVKRLTDDHIVPKAWGGRRRSPHGTSNIRRMCKSCNEFRGQAQHCTAVLIMAKMHAKDTGIGCTRTVLSRWGFIGYGMFRMPETMPDVRRHGRLTGEFMLIVKTDTGTEIEHARGPDKDALVQIGREQFPGAFRLKPIRV